MNACLLHLTQPDQALPSELLQATPTKRIGRRWIPLVGGSGLLLLSVLWLVFFLQPPAGPDGNGPAAGNSPAGNSAATAEAAGKGAQIATVLGKPIHEGDLNKNVNAKENLIFLLLDPLMAHYCKKQEIDREAELTARIKNEAIRKTASVFVLRAELNRHLYEKHGGRVVLTAFGPWAVDAQQKWLAAMEQAGNFKITDPGLRAQLQKYLTPDAEGTVFASPEQVKAAFDPAITERFIENFTKTPNGAQPGVDHRLIGEVLGQRVRLHRRYLENPAELPEILRGLFVAPLEEHYRKQHPELEPTAAEIDTLSTFARKSNAQDIAAYRQAIGKIDDELSRAEKGSDLFGELEAQKSVLENKLQRTEGADGRETALSIARPLKFQKHLYDTYGGGRGLRTPQTTIAFDAQKKWVEERERLGEFQIADPAVRAAFYQAWAGVTQQQRINLLEDRRPD